MALKVKAQEKLQKIGTYAGKYRYIMMPELYTSLSQEKVIKEAALLNQPLSPTPARGFLLFFPPKSCNVSKKYVSLPRKNKKSRVMSNKEIEEFNEKIRRGLELAEKRMLQEKALRNQDVVVCGADQIIRRIPAKQVIADNPIFQD